MSRRIMAPDEIERQRAVGWPEIHPEDFCHRCGMENMLWAAEREEWLKATKAWAAETGREGIVARSASLTCTAKRPARRRYGSSSIPSGSRR